MAFTDQYKNIVKKFLPVKLWSSLRQPAYDIRSLFYKGTDFKCPVCDHSFRNFIDGGRVFPVLKELSVVGGGFVENNFCPKCNSGYKERLFYLYLRDIKGIFQVPSALSVLHIAPEWSLRNRFEKRRFERYVTGDLNSSLVDQRIDITSIPFDDCSFDVVLCNHVIEHVIDDLAAIREIKRILKPDGYAVLQVPYTTKTADTLEDPNADSWSNQEREQAFGQWDHVRLYSMDSYVSRLSSVGFEVETFRWSSDSYYTDKWGNAGLNTNEVVFCVHPRP